MNRLLPSALLTVIAAAFLVDSAWAQEGVFGPNGAENELVGEGWSGFANVTFLIEALLAFVLATVLGAVIAHHPRTRVAVDTVEEADAPKTFITYSLVGALIGLMVLQYGLVVGFVVFGIGGLTRFRTVLPSTTKTGRLIFVTLTGLAAGLNLPTVAVLATAFVYGLIFVLESRITFSMTIKGLEEAIVIESSKAHRSVLEDRDYKLISEKRNLSKGRVDYVFQAPPQTSTEEIEDAVAGSVPPNLRGPIDWEVA